MAQLGEVLGGLLTDVVRARMAADLVTARAVETYRADPALASMAVPRVTVSNLTVRLNFSVNTVQNPAPVPLDLERARDRWTALMQARLVPGLPEPVKPPAGPAPADSPLGAGPVLGGPPLIRPVPVTAAHLDTGLGGNVEPLVTATVAHLLEGRGRIPKADQEEVAKQVREQALAFVDSLRQQQFTDLAIRSTMDVEVVADKVSQAPAQTLQSLEVTFSVDDLEEVLALPEQWR